MQRCHAGSHISPFVWCHNAACIKRRDSAVTVGLALQGQSVGRYLLVPDDLHASADLPHRLVDACQALFQSFFTKLVHLLPIGHRFAQLLGAVLYVLQPSAVEGLSVAKLPELACLLAW